MIRKIIGIFVVTLLIATALPLVSGDNPVLLKTIIVPDDYSTIQKAINNANDGDTIYVRAGTYYENLIVDKSLILSGENRETTIIDAGGIGTVVTVTADYVTLSGFTITNSGDFNVGIHIPSGIEIIESSYINISSNIISNNLHGIMFDTSKKNIVHSNKFINDGICFAKGFKPSYDHDIQDNTVNGKPVYHYKNKDDFTVPTDAGQIILFNCNNVMISDMNIEFTDWAIQLQYCNGCIVQNSVISDNEWLGIQLRFSDENKIKGNTLSSNRAYGIDFEYSARNEIIDNLITDDTWIGISLYESCEGNKISRNTIDIQSSHTIFEHPSTGIWLRDYCSLNKIADNTISNCQIGLWMGCSHYNTIERNLIKDCHIISSQQSNTGIIDSIAANSESGAAPLISRGSGLYLVDTGNNEIRFNTLEHNDIGIIIFTSWLDNIRLNNIQDSTTGFDFISLLSLGYYPLNYWGSSITGPIFKSNKLFCLLPWSPIRISEAP